MTDMPPHSAWRYTRRYLRRSDMTEKYGALVAAMTADGWEVASIEPTHAYKRSFWEERGKGAFEGIYIVFRTYDAPPGLSSIPPEPAPMSSDPPSMPSDPPAVSDETTLIR